MKGTWSISRLEDASMGKHKLADSEFDSLWMDGDDQPEYIAAGLGIEFSEAIWDVMQHEGVSKKALADSLGSSQAYVTKVLSGASNYTLASLVKLTGAVGCSLSLEICPAGQSQVRIAPQVFDTRWVLEVEWTDRIDGPPEKVSYCSRRGKTMVSSDHKKGEARAA